MHIDPKRRQKLLGVVDFAKDTGKYPGGSPDKGLLRLTDANVEKCRLRAVDALGQVFEGQFMC